MKREVSIYIDLLRFIAALAVLAEHGSDYVGGWIWRFGNFGGEAVGVFFVLSGLVISHVTTEREQSVTAYARARAVRLYSVVIPAIAVTLVLDAIGRHYYATPYSTAIYVDGTFIDYLRCLTFTNQLWSWETHLGTMGPYWSLGFEVPYYVIYGALIFFPRTWPRKYLLAIVCALLLIAGPRITCYFPLWLMGVGCQKLIRKYQQADVNGKALRLAWFSILLATPLLLFLWREFNYLGATHRIKIGSPIDFVNSYYRPIVYYYGLGIILSLHLVAFATLSSSFTALSKCVENSVRWLAGATFTLYLVNLPILLCLKSIMSTTPTSGFKTSGMLATTLLFSFLLAELCERRNSISRQTLIRLLSARPR